MKGRCADEDHGRTRKTRFRNDGLSNYLARLPVLGGLAVLSCYYLGQEASISLSTLSSGWAPEK